MTNLLRDHHRDGRERHGTPGQVFTDMRTCAWRCRLCQSQAIEWNKLYKSLRNWIRGVHGIISKDLHTLVPFRSCGPIARTVTGCKIGIKGHDETTIVGGCCKTDMCVHPNVVINEHQLACSTRGAVRHSDSTTECSPYVSLIAALGRARPNVIWWATGMNEDYGAPADRHNRGCAYV